MQVRPPLCIEDIKFRLWSYLRTNYHVKASSTDTAGQTLPDHGTDIPVNLREGLSDTRVRYPRRAR